MAKPLSTSKILSSPTFQEQDLDEQFLTLDRLRQNNVTYIDEQFSSGNIPTPDEYATKVNHYNGVIRKAKSGLLLNELGNKLTQWAMENDTSPDAARDMLLNNPDRDALPPGLAELNDWLVGKNKEIEKSASSAGWSPFNHMTVETDQNVNFGDAQMFQDAKGDTKVALNFATDENGQELPGAERRRAIIGLEDKHGETLKQLGEEVKKLEEGVEWFRNDIEDDEKRLVARGVNPSGLTDEQRGHLTELERELEEKKSRLTRYSDGNRGRNEYFRDQMSQKIKDDPNLFRHVPHGGNVFSRVGADMGIGLLQTGVNTAAGASMIGDALWIPGARETAVDLAQMADTMGVTRAVAGMGQTRNSDTVAAGALMLISDEVPQIGLEVGTGGLAALVTRGAIRSYATRTATKEVFEAAASRVVKENLPSEIRNQITENVTEAYANSLTRRYGAKVAAAVGALPGGMADAAGNISIMQDAADNLEREAARLESAGDLKGAEEKKLRAREIEEDMSIAYMSHFGSTYALEFLPLERLFRRGDDGLTLSENVFAAAERKAKGLSPDAAVAAGRQRASEARSAVENFLSSRFGSKLTNSLKQGSMEAVTEVLQTISDNKIAQEFYDENRDTYEGIEEAAAGGAFLGFALGWVASVADPHKVRAAANQEAATADKAKLMANESLEKVIGAPIDGQVAAAPNTVVEQQGNKFFVQDPDMPEDSGFSNIAFNTQEEALAWAENRWENYGMSKMADVLSKTTREDGSAYTPEEVASAIAVTRQLVNGVSQGANVSKESTWKALSNSIQFSESDPTVSNDTPPQNVLSGISQLQERMRVMEEQGFTPEPALKQGVEEYSELVNAWNSRPEDQRGPQPQPPMIVGLAMKAMENTQKQAAQSQNQQLNQDIVPEFRGENRFLSNFHPAQVSLDGKLYPSVEHAYQAAKTDDPVEREKIRNAPTAGEAKRLGKKVKMRKDWDGVKDSVMEDLVRQKFNTPELRQKLNATGSARLIEGNTWGDKYWGQVEGQGQNKLGEILMKVRGETPQTQNKPDDTKPTEQETPFQVWQSAVRRRFAPDSQPSDVEMAEIQALRAVFGENAPVNPDGTLDTLTMLQQLAQEPTPLGQLSGLLSDILPTMNLSSDLLRYRMSPQLSAQGIDSPAEQGDVVVGQDDKSAAVGQNTPVVQFVNRLASDAIGTTLNNYVTAVKSNIQSRAAMQAPIGARAAGMYASENTPSAMEARVAFETALPFSVVKEGRFPSRRPGAQSTPQPYTGVRGMDAMKIQFIMSELAEAMGGLPPEALARAVSNNQHKYGATPPGPDTGSVFYIQTPPDGRAIPWANDGGGWRRMALGKVTKQNEFDTGWESRLARLYLRTVVSSGFFDTLFEPQSGLAGTSLTRTEYRATHGNTAPAYNLTTFSRFVQAVISDPVFANRIGKPMRGFPGINMRDQVFSDVVNNALGAKTMEPDPTKRWLMAEALKLGQAPTLSGIPGNSPQWGPQTPVGGVETAMQPGGVDSRRTPGPRLQQGLTKQRIASSTVPPQQVAERRASAQNYAVSFQGSRQDATGVDPQGERTTDQIDPSEMPLRVDAELTISPSGRFIGEGANFTEDEGRKMYSDASRRPRLSGEEIDAMSETDDVSEDEFEELNEQSEQEASDYFTAFELMAQKAADEAEGTVEGDSQIIAAAINGIDREVTAADIGNESDNTMSVINAFIDSPNTTIEQFNQLLSDLEGQISDDSLKDLAKMWFDNRVPKVEEMVKQKGEIYRAAVAAITPKGMTRQQSVRIGAEPMLDGPDPSEEQQPVPALQDQPVVGVDSNAVLAVTGEDPISVLLEHVRKFSPVELNAAHNLVMELAENFGLDVGETYDNSEGDLRMPSTNGHGWLMIEKVLSALRATKNPISMAEQIGADIPMVMNAMMFNPQDMSNAHALATAFVDSVAQSRGAAGFEVKLSNEVTGNENVDRVETPTEEPNEDLLTPVKTKSAGTDIDEAMAKEEQQLEPGQVLVQRGPQPGPSQQFTNRTSRYNLPNKGGNATRTYPVGMRPFIVVGKKRVAVTDDTKWQSLEGKSVREVYDQLTQSLGMDLDRNAMDSLYLEVWRRALSGQKGRAALKANRAYINEYRQKWNKELPMVSPEAPVSRTMSPAKAIAKLVNTELGNVSALDQNNGVRAGFIDTTTRLITILKAGNPSTLIHETVHWLRLTKTNSGLSMFDAALGTHRPHFMNWATKGGALDPNRDFVQVEERIAKGLEQYLREGNVPSVAKEKGVDAAFRRIAALMKRIYHALADSAIGGAELTAEARRGYEKLFGTSKPSDNLPSGPVQLNLPTAATDDEVDALVREAEAFGKTIPRELAQEAIEQEKKAPRNLMPVVRDTEMTQYPGDPTTLLFSTNPSATPARGSRQYKVNMLRALYRTGKRAFTKWFTAQGHAPWSAFAESLRGQGMRASIEREMLKIQSKLEKAIEKAAKESGFAGAQDARFAIHRDLNAYLVEQNPVDKAQLFAALPTMEIKRAAVSARKYVDELSRYLIRTGVVKGPMAVTIQSKIGFYLHRSYEMSKDPIAWKDEMLVGMMRPIYDRALDVIAQTRGVTLDEAENVASQIFASLDNAGADDPSGRAIDSTILMATSREFADIQQAADMLLGLKQDPLNNFSKTVEGMAHLITQHEMLSRILSDGLSKGYIRDGRQPITAANRHLTSPFFKDKKTVTDQEWINNPAEAHMRTILAGRYSTPEFTEWVNELLQGKEKMTRISRLTANLNGFFKTANTVHNWISGLRNVMGATLGLWGQGHTGRYLGKAIKLVVQDGFKRQMDPADEALFQELLEYNIAESATLAELRDYSRRGFNLEEASNHVLKVRSRLLGGSQFKGMPDMSEVSTLEKGWREAWHRAFRGAMKYNEFRKKVYGGTDVVAKIAAYMEEKDNVRRMFPGLTEKQIKEEASRRTHLTMFSFDMLPKAVNAFRTHGFTGTLFGPFVSFPYSMLRIFANTIGVGATDLHQGFQRGGVGDPQFRNGVARLAAMTTVAWGTRMAIIMVNNMLGWEEEDEMAARKMLAEWDREGNLLFTTEKNPIFSCINMSTILPFSYVTDAVAALVGNTSDTPKTVTDSIANMGEQLIKPFAAEQFTFKALTDAWRNQNDKGQQLWVKGSTFYENVGRVTSNFIGGMWPGDIKNLIRLGFNPGNIGKFLGATPNMNMGDYEKAIYAAGVKVQTVDIDRSLPFQVREWATQYKLSMTDFYRAAGGAQPVSREQLRDYVKFALQRHKDITAEASVQTRNLIERFHYEPEKVDDAFKDTSLVSGVVIGGKLSEDQRDSIWYGQWVGPVTLSDKQFNDIVNAAGKAQQPERIQWIEEMIAEGLLDVKSGR